MVPSPRSASSSVRTASFHPCNQKKISRKQHGFRDMHSMVSANFAVEMRHLHFGIARPGGGAFGHCILDSAQVFACKLDVECAQRFAQPVAASRTNHRYDVL